MSFIQNNIVDVESLASLNSISVHEASKEASPHYRTEKSCGHEKPGDQTDGQLHIHEAVGNEFSQFDFIPAYPIMASGSYWEGLYDSDNTYPVYEETNKHRSKHSKRTFSNSRPKMVPKCAFHQSNKSSDSNERTSHRKFDIDAIPKEDRRHYGTAKEERSSSNHNRPATPQGPPSAFYRPEDGFNYQPLSKSANLSIPATVEYESNAYHTYVGQPSSISSNISVPSRVDEENIKYHTFVGQPSSISSNISVPSTVDNENLKDHTYVGQPSSISSNISVRRTVDNENIKYQAYVCQPSSISSNISIPSRVGDENIKYHTYVGQPSSISTNLSIPATVEDEYITSHSHICQPSSISTNLSMLTMVKDENINSHSYHSSNNHEFATHGAYNTEAVNDVPGATALFDNAREHINRGVLHSPESVTDIENITSAVCEDEQPSFNMNTVGFQNVDDYSLPINYNDTRTLDDFRMLDLRESDEQVRKPTDTSDKYFRQTSITSVRDPISNIVNQMGNSARVTPAPLHRHNSNQMVYYKKNNTPSPVLSAGDLIVSSSGETTSSSFGSCSDGEYKTRCIGPGCMNQASSFPNFTKTLCGSCFDILMKARSNEGLQNRVMQTLRTCKGPYCSRESDSGNKGLCNVCHTILSEANFKEDVIVRPLVRRPEDIGGQFRDDRIPWDVYYRTKPPPKTYLQQK